MLLIIFNKNANTTQQLIKFYLMHLEFFTKVTLVILQNGLLQFCVLNFYIKLYEVALKPLPKKFVKALFIENNK